MKNRNLFRKQIHTKLLSLALSGTLTLSLLPAFSFPVRGAADEMPALLKAGSIPVSEETMTYAEPFASGTGGSKTFRIPGLICLENGDLVATADARWENSSDGGGLDTIASVSSDGGKTWNYSFPMYFADSKGYAGNRATTIIDPGVVEGPDGTVYCFADVNPTGSTTLYKTIGVGTGYVTVNGGRYLALTQEYGNVETCPTDSDLTTYPYYIENLDENGFARILSRSDNSETGYGVDEWYNLYTINEEGEYVDNLTQKQVNTDVDVQQNVFYKDSLFHVYSIGYIWCVTSKDHGRTWEHPRNINDEVKRPTRENAILVSPGQGITTSTGDLVLGYYDHGDATGDAEENASLAWSPDNGQSWKRSNDVPGAKEGGGWSSENEIVELEDGTLRMFLRSGAGAVSYSDAVKDSEGNYVMQKAVKTNASCNSSCNVSAISYSKRIQGKQAIIVSCPGGPGRKNGKLYTFLVEEDNSMTLFSTFDVPESSGGYCYSCLTEMPDGSLALLWEPSHSMIYFDRFSFRDVVPEGEADASSSYIIDLKPGETYTQAGLTDTEILPDENESLQDWLDDSILTASVENGTLTIEALHKGWYAFTLGNSYYEIYVNDEETGNPSDNSCSHSSTYEYGGQPASCEHPGQTPDIYCSLCNGLVEKGETIPATGHDWDEANPESVKEMSDSEYGLALLTCRNRPAHKSGRRLYHAAQTFFKEAYAAAAPKAAQNGLYTEESFQALQEAYALAVPLAESQAPQNPTLYRTGYQLNAAAEQLVVRSSEDIYRDLLLERAEAKKLYNAGKGSLSDAVWNPFAKAYQAAEQAASSQNPETLWKTLDSLRTSYEKAYQASDDAANAADRARLASLLRQAASLQSESASYTQESWASFLEVYKTVLKDWNPASIETVRKNAALLQQAMDKLVKISVPQKLKAGLKVTINGINYKVLDANARTAMIVSLKNKKAKSLNVPDTITIEGQTCKVTQLDANLCKNNKSLKKVVHGKHVSTIGKQAFMGCKNLKSIRLKGKALKTLKAKALKGTHAKLKISAKGWSKKKKSSLLKACRKAGMNKRGTVK